MVCKIYDLKKADGKLREFIASKVAHIMYKMEDYVVIKKGQANISILRHNQLCWHRTVPNF